MSLSGTLMVLQRRWIALALGLIIVVAAMVTVTKVVKPQYQAVATILLTEPVPNPYSNINGDTSVFTRAVAAIASDSQEATALEKRGYTASYTVSPSDSIESVLTVGTVSSSPDTANATAAAVVAETAKAATDLQTAMGVPTGYRILVQPLDNISVRPFTKNRVRLLALVGVSGLAIVVLGVFGMEAAFRRRGGVTAVAYIRALWRWLPAAGAVMVLLVLAVGYSMTRPHEYQASETVIVVPPRLPPKPGVPLLQQGGLNPFLSYDRSLDVLAQLGTIRTTDPSMASLAAAGDATVPYTVTNWMAGPTPVDTLATPTPYVTIEATAEDPGEAMRAVRAVGDMFSRAVATLQSAPSAPPVTRASVYTAVPAQVYQVPVSKARALAALCALAFASGVIALTVARGSRRVLRRNLVLIREPGPVGVAHLGGQR